jgi:crotonobetaine/carnitine-CoA ligase
VYQSELPSLEGFVLPAFPDRLLGRFPIEQARLRPDAPALEFSAENTRWTYGEFVRDAAALADGFRSLGLVPGDRLGIMMPNRSEYVLAWFASLFCGMVDVGLNHGVGPAMLTHQLRIAGVKAVVCDRESFAALVAAAPEVTSLELLIPVDEVDRTAATTLRTVRFDRLGGSSAEPTFDFGSPTDITSIRYTSGTTGPAKAVASTNSQKSVSTSMFAQLMGYTPTDKLYTCFPLHHSMASMMGVVASFQAGGCCVVDDRFSASRYWSRIEQVGATLGHVMTPMLPMLLSQPPSASDQGHQCRRLWTASPHPEFESRFSVTLQAHYSMSEVSPVAFPRVGGPNKLGSSGQIGPLYDVRIVDETEHPVAVGQRGEILLRPLFPHTIFAGYYGNEAETAAVLRGLWYHTGDEGFVDEDGYLFLVGRMGDQIRRRGVNISAQDIEDAARRHPQVQEAAAIAVASEVGESEVKVFLIPRQSPPPSAEDILAFFAGELPREMIPRYLEWRDELPRTPTNKISKLELKQARAGAVIHDLHALRQRRG